MATRWIGSPIGGLRSHVSAGLVTRIDFDAEPHGAPAADRVLDLAAAQLTQYFAGERTDFTVPLASDGTEFQQKVWNAVRKIGFGQTATYGEIAANLGYDAAVSRAVGAANGANPIPILVPCHRVIGADGTLTGYAGGIARKQTLLALEQPGLF